MHWDNILVTTDFSEIAQTAFDYAAFQAKMEDSKITLLNVFEEFELPPELRRIIWNPENIVTMKRDYIAAAQKKLEEIAKDRFHGQDVECISLMSPKSPGKEICRIAKEKGCDLIVMAGHGRGLAATLMLGSVVHKVLSEAPCPVLVIRGQQGQ